MHDQPPRTFSRRLSLLASIGLVIVLGAGLTWYKGHRTATAAVASQRAPPGRRRHPHRRPVLQHAVVDAHRPVAAAPQGRAVREHVRLESALRPFAGEHPDRPVLAHDGRVRQRAVQLRLGGGLPRLRLRELHDGHVVPRRGLPDGHRRQVRQRLRRRVDAAGLGRVGDRRRVLGADAVRERRQAHLPALDVRDDAARRQGRRVHRRRAARQAAVPLSGAVRAARERLAGAEVRPPPGRPRTRLAAAELRRGRRVGQALVHPQHPAPRRVRSLGGELVAPAPVPDAAVGRRHGREGVGCSEDPRLVAEHDPRIHE